MSGREHALEAALREVVVDYDHGQREPNEVTLARARAALALPPDAPAESWVEVRERAERAEDERDALRAEVATLEAALRAMLGAFGSAPHVDRTEDPRNARAMARAALAKVPR